MNIVKPAGAGALILAAASIAAAPASAQRMIVLASGNTTAFEQATDGIRAIPGIVVETADLRSESRDALRERLGHAGRDVAVVTLGTTAARYVASMAPAGPVVNCLAFESRVQPRLPSAIAWASCSIRSAIAAAST